ncbi:MAG: hypothetical protein KBH24_02695, partial [Brachymonas sp.]|nr:hypothetical protein [Brachymonas sp.]MBP8746695.1 hypothetical protein [Brachymonas sp.]
MSHFISLVPCKGKIIRQNCQVIGQVCRPFNVRVIRVFYCFGIVRNGKSRKQYLCALQGCFVPQGALMLVVL